MNKEFSKRSEMLSAYFDGELSEVELQNLVNNISAEELVELKKYHLMQAAAKNQLTDKQLTFDISSKVAEAIRNETCEAPKKQVASNLFGQRITSLFQQFKPAAGFAVAATVTFFVVVGFQQNSEHEFIVDGEIKPAHSQLDGGAEVIPASAKFKKADQEENETENGDNQLQP